MASGVLPLSSLRDRLRALASSSSAHAVGSEDVEAHFDSPSALEEEEGGGNDTSLSVQTADILKFNSLALATSRSTSR